jgi:hypothetical protein
MHVTQREILLCTWFLLIFYRVLFFLPKWRGFYGKIDMSRFFKYSVVLVTNTTELKYFLLTTTCASETAKSLSDRLPNCPCCFLYVLSNTTQTFSSIKIATPLIQCSQWWTPLHTTLFDLLHTSVMNAKPTSKSNHASSKTCNFPKANIPTVTLSTMLSHSKLGKEKQF